MPVRIAAAQIDIAFADKEANLAKIEAWMDRAAGEGAALAVFPECAVSGYCFDRLAAAQKVAEPIPGPATDRLARVCARRKMFVIAGMLEADGPRVFNAAVLVGPGGVIGSYRKIHLPYLGVDRFTTPGDRPFAVHEAAGIRIGMNICYDGSFPESARVLALLGADLVVLPTNWPPHSECMATCVLNARAMENQVYYLAVNRVGKEGGFPFIGMSKVCAPGGRTLCEAMHTDETLLLADVDVAKAREKHIVRVPGLHEIDRFRDRRPEMYGKLTEPK